jgi:hypothetical protein
MRQSDPFPIPYQGLEPSHELGWEGMAKRVIRDSLKLERHERVILSANPYCGGAMLDAIRVEIQRADAIELATILHWTPDIAPQRGPGGCKADPESERREDDAMRAMFAVADVFIWLQNDWRPDHSTHAVGQSEKVLEDWPGRSVHFHWFHDPNDPDPDSAANKALNLVYQRAVLDLDQPAVRRTMDTLVAKTRGKSVRVTDPAGTDLSFHITERFCLNDGDASRAKMAAAENARDREEEIPCGALRTIPDQDSASGVMAFDTDPGYPVLGYGLDFRPFMRSGLRIHFEAGRITRLETDGDQAELDRLWSEQTGDRDRLGEFVLGCNPLLTEVEGSSFLPYCGFGDGVLRLAIGENIESGGTNTSNLHRWMMFRQATISVDGEELVSNGRLTPAGKGV